MKHLSTLTGTTNKYFNAYVVLSLALIVIGLTGVITQIVKAIL